MPTSRPARRLTTQLDAIEIRKAAQVLRGLWVLGNEYLQEAAPWTAIKTDPARAAVVVRTGLNLAALYARVSAPFIPFAAQSISEAFGEPWPPSWPSMDAAAELSRLEPGRPVRVPEVLFKKVEDDQIADWTARFGGAD
jgi:methionyl-tRNA synthetase